jgi:hypothetical protein
MLGTRGWSVAALHVRVWRGEERRSEMLGELVGPPQMHPLTLVGALLVVVLCLALVATGYYVDGVSPRL